MRRGGSALPSLLALAALALAALAPGLATAAGRTRGGSALARRRSAAEGQQESMHARGRRMQMGYWIRNGGCLSSSYCSSNGWCESASTWTTTRGCGGSKTVSTRESASSNCRNTGCWPGGCNNDEIEVSASRCWWGPYDERCCKKMTTSTCRDWLACSWVSYPSPPPPPPSPRYSPPPPPPPPRRSPPPPQSSGSSGGSSTAVFASGGVWDAFASSHKNTNGYIAAIMALHAYEDTLGASSLDDWANKFRARLMTPMGATRAWFYRGYYDTEWFFMETRDTIFVSFRGTEGGWSRLVDGATDLSSAVLTDASQFFGGNAWTGAGFYLSFLANVRTFNDELDKFTGTSTIKKIWVTGHSLGGALATLFAAHVERNTRYYVQGVYTFGSPKVGDSDWRDAYPLNSRTYRYENNGDPVTILPPDDDDWSFSHVGNKQSLSSCSAAGRRRRSAQQQSAGTYATTTGSSAVNSSAPLVSGGDEASRPCGSVRVEANGTVSSTQFSCTAANLTAILDSLLASSNSTSSGKSAAEKAGSPAPSPELATLDTLGSIDGGSGTGAASTTSATSSGATETRNWFTDIVSGIITDVADMIAGIQSAIASHSMKDAYMRNIYYCTLSSSDRNRAPSWSWASKP
ncbi:hypothetical protein HXX76_015426 [Chlamydomonas incerta]|uniref:Fungal lipase-type domain-containing protein n=1 Tax=Chlamydomonas incerta TaxID=51695 RepID=A0A835S9N1_CHLIN|nr:hypothetical protein HXX76_015426 [Chlamydomonas incerta]|eukprot:KAG2423277.1 hypothetical protein HXX76_015426 [Chlamydomonas incerta]